MTLYNKIVIINPFSVWSGTENYFVGNTVSFTGLYYMANIDNIGDQPLGASWTLIFPTNPDVDISDFIETILDTEIGSGEVRSATLRINADRGAFITDTNGGLTPIIDEFTKFKTIIIDSIGNEYTTLYETDIIHPTQDAIQGTVLPVDLLGPEFYLQKTLFAEQFFFKSMFDVSNGIIKLYNKNKGTLQPRVIDGDADFSNGGFNNLPVFTANDYTFNLNEKITL